MRRLLPFFPLILLTGAALGSQTLALASNLHHAGPTYTPLSLLQWYGVEVPEPLSIVLSNLALFGWITAVRRNRVNRRNN
jgi:hypothetical protein